MLIKSVYVGNYRSIQSATLKLDDLTALVGTNGAGKSSFLRAIELFYSPTPEINPDDFFGGDLSNEIVISLTFTDLDQTAKQRFAKYLQDDTLTVDMVVVWESDKAKISYHGSKLQNPDFQLIRDAANKNTARTCYSQIREQEKYRELPSCSNYDQVVSAIETWEDENACLCQRTRDDGQFFGFKQVGRGYLLDYTQFLFIGAVRNAAQDCQEGRGAVITQLMDLVVRTTLANRQELTGFKQEAQVRYEQILDPANLQELATLRIQLSSTLCTFVPDASIELDWQPLEKLNIPMPKAEVGLVEDGYKTKVEMAGHGLQRAFIFTILQHLSIAQRTVRDSNPNEDQLPEQSVELYEAPTLIIAIEEPELYQHPNRQRHFANVLRQLSSGELAGVAQRIQIVYATHSPLFIDIEHFSQVRLIKKKSVDPESPKTSTVFHAHFDDILERMRESKDNEYYSADELHVSLPQLMTPFINEGFFADVAVIVEGESDRAALLEVARLEKSDLESMGVAIVPAGGKGKLVIPAVIFHHLGIPVYIMWDQDKQEDSKDLLRFVGYDKRLRGDLITATFACFCKNREHTMKMEIGNNVFTRLCNRCEAELGTDDLKKPLVIRNLIRLAFEEGHKSQSMVEAVSHIVAMRDQTLMAIERVHTRELWD